MFRFVPHCAGAQVAIITAVVLAGCTVPVAPDTATHEPQQPPSCTPASAASDLTGNWLAVRAQKGVTGELRTLFTLNADGTLTYTEQLKRGGKPSQGLSETGCWGQADNVLTLQTHESNSYPVDLKDPIYTNRYTVESVDNNLLRLRAADGETMTARKMPAGYRLPF